jgi:hypothetical protein
MSQSRRNLWLSGLSGLLASALVAAASAWLSTSGFVEPMLPYPIFVVLLGLILAAFSLAEIPMMIVTMRRLAVERPENHRVVWGLNAFYVLFAAVYGAPLILLTGSVGWGLALCGLSLIRLAASLVFVSGTLP